MDVSMANSQKSKWNIGARRFPVLRAGLVLAPAFLLGGCVFNALTVLAGMEVASLVNTNRTMGDQVISHLTEQDCSVIYAKDEGHYCRSENLKVVHQPYCYKSLAGVDCYAEPDPYHDQSQTVDYAYPNLYQ